MTNVADLLIIGGGPAGIQTARMVKMKRPEMRVAMLRPERASMVYCAIPYALEGIIDARKVLKSDDLVTGAGVELIRESATAVDTGHRRVETDTGRVLNYRTLLFAPGATGLMPPVPGRNLGGVFTVKTEDDMNRIMARLEAGAERAVVIGAGAIGLEQAQAYRSRGLTVHLVDLADRILPHLTDADMSEPLTHLLIDSGIDLHLKSKLSAFRGDGEVSEVVLDSGDTFALTPGRDFAVVAVGMKPLSGLLDGQVDTGPDGIIVNARMETSVAGVYAAGDVVQGWSGIDGKPLGGRLATNAVPMAKIAAINILGGNAQYPGFFNGAATVVGEMRIGGTGFTETYARDRGYEVVTGYGETTSRFPMMPGARPVKVKLIADTATGRIIGGQVTAFEAVTERIDVITLAIQQRMTASELMNLSYSAQPWQTFFPARNAIVQAATALNDRLMGTD
ncbi:MAG TPA: FAD-dependent oxidoreductase [bacterium]|nr:FAD-dependent oxidoreductase [bacterium]